MGAQTGTEPAVGMKHCPAKESRVDGDSILMDLLVWSKSRPAGLTSTVHIT